MIQPPDGYTAISEVFAAALSLAPAFAEWRKGKGWPSIYPNPERCWEKTGGVRPIRPHDAYRREIDFAAWQAVASMLAQGCEAIVTRPFCVPEPFDLRPMCDMAVWPDTPLFDARTGQVAWNQAAFDALIPQDYGQERVWRGWVAGLKGAKIFIRTDSIGGFASQPSVTAPAKPSRFKGRAARERGKRIWGHLSNDEFTAARWKQLLHSDDAIADTPAESTRKKALMAEKERRGLSGSAKK